MIVSLMWQAFSEVMKIIDKREKKKKQRRNLNITKRELKKLFLFATSQTHFLFNGKFYNQIDGVAMGSPLTPVLANIFMGFYESK